MHAKFSKYHSQILFEKLPEENKWTSICKAQTQMLIIISMSVLDCKSSEYVDWNTWLLYFSTKNTTIFASFLASVVRRRRQLILIEWNQTHVIDGWHGVIISQFPLILYPPLPICSLLFPVSCYSLTPFPHILSFFIIISNIPTCFNRPCPKSHQACHSLLNNLCNDYEIWEI